MLPEMRLRISIEEKRFNCLENDKIIWQGAFQVSQKCTNKLSFVYYANEVLTNRETVERQLISHVVRSVSKSNEFAQKQDQ